MSSTWSNKLSAEMEVTSHRRGPSPQVSRGVGHQGFSQVGRLPARYVAQSPMPGTSISGLIIGKGANTTLSSLFVCTEILCKGP